MPKYIPDTNDEQELMLKDIGLNKIEDLYSMVPKDVLLKNLNIPEGKSELEVSNIMKRIANENKLYHSIFRGAGAYKHYIPSIVKTVTSKEEFLTNNPWQKLMNGVIY